MTTTVETPVVNAVRQLPDNVLRCFVTDPLYRAQAFEILRRHGPKEALDSLQTINLELILALCDQPRVDLGSAEDMAAFDTDADAFRQSLSVTTSTDSTATG